MNKQYLPFFAVILIVILIFSPSIAGADSKSRCNDPAGYQNVTVTEAHKMIEKKDVFILDVRIPDEYKYGHIEGATLIPVSSAPKINPEPLPENQLLKARLDELPKNKNKRILVYCKVGTRSPKACDILVGAGYKRVYNMVGGIDAWVSPGSEGYPIVFDPAKWAASYPHA